MFIPLTVYNIKKFRTLYFIYGKDKQNFLKFLKIVLSFEVAV